ncbi:MAG: hypothetical protein ACMG6E_08295 [Candidatus Roizmanbacteria bacterium]
MSPNILVFEELETTRSQVSQPVAPESTFRQMEETHGGGWV